jgi:outer membrane protein OmpA-like peptidoglycan-associated protein
MEPPVRGDDDRGDEEAKLVPEWGLDGDDQIVVAGLGVLAILALGLFWQAWPGGADDGGRPESEVATSEVDVELADPAREGDGGVAGVENAAPSSATVPEEAGAGTSTTISPPAGPTTAARATAGRVTITVARSVVDGVLEATSGLPGRIEARADGAEIVLTGFVANEAESREAQLLATAVAGVDAVGNELVLLEPAVAAALVEAGVDGATAVGRGTSVTVSGTVDSEADRSAALAAALAVDGVTEIVDDRLNLAAATALDQLPQIRFAYGSARIPAVGHPDLDRAAELLRGAGAIDLEIRGYTDASGSPARNLRLSQARAESVRNYLLDAGVGEASLSAIGFGETEQFGAAPEANRVVRFRQIDE